MNKITEIIPDNLPEWAKEAMLNGQLFCTLLTKVKALECQIDMLMLEYCPDEMPNKQIKEWGRHQVSADDELTPS